MDQNELVQKLDKALKFSFEERNVLYFTFKDIIEKNNSNDAAKKILTHILELLRSRSENVEIDAIEGSLEGNQIKGGVFRRVPS